ncbi:MAG: Na(+)-translocating NADH-quinone reductase subunit C [Chlamydiales bacterium]|nr:Na(+)-translocating NADH-quinone reductase subunit C [Chlamydiales bacterium]MCH9619981.1 Na(+)-translocating NADH-quinone reductase subunit C [Chlamydiales bacterium]MCH9622592.1 Na(+)-translocating NADH-quinone reductase subunit C [Chlamydiales bacterium]
MLIAADIIDQNASAEEIKTIAETRIHPFVTDSKGEVYTLEEKKLTLTEYLDNNQKQGYANLPLKLFYVIMPNEKEDPKDFSKAQAIVIPVSGFGLWAPIYGYLAIEPNGDTIIGTTWYDMAETPGLGANIAESWWQSQFRGKLIFHEDGGGKTDFQTAEMGIIVVKGKVKDVFGETPKAKSAVDGVSGATLTGNGVTAAYQDSLTPYRAFLIKLHGEKKSNDSKDTAP